MAEIVEWLDELGSGGSSWVRAADSVLSGDGEVQLVLSFDGGVRCHYITSDEGDVLEYIAASSKGKWLSRWSKKSVYVYV